MENTGIKILLIEDNEQDALLFREYLKDMSKTITHVQWFHEGVKELDEHQFDVVFVDLLLPDSDGLKSLPMVIEKAGNTPVVVLTGFYDDSLGIEAVKMGAQDYLIKGQFEHYLKRTIFFAIERSKIKSEIKETSSRLLDEKVKLNEILHIEEHLHSLSDINELNQYLIKKISDLLDAKRCSIMYYDDKKKSFYVQASLGYSLEQNQMNLPKLGEPVAGLVAQNGNPVLVRDIEEDGRFKQKNKAVYTKKSFLSVPIKLGEHVLGVVNVSEKISDKLFFDEMDLKVLMVISRQMGVAIEKLQAFGHMEKLASTDPMTELYNHRFFVSTLTREMLRAKRYEKGLSVVMMDIDDFKSYNDQFGHLEGDALLKKISAVIKTNVRDVDIPCRYAGDEFVIVLPESNLEQAAIVANKIKATMQQLDFKKKVTFSIGVASFETDLTENEFISRADQALYKAKMGGKNQVQIYSQLEANE